MTNKNTNERRRALERYQSFEFGFQMTEYKRRKNTPLQKHKTLNTKVAIHTHFFKFSSTTPEATGYNIDYTFEKNEIFHNAMKHTFIPK